MPDFGSPTFILGLIGAGAAVVFFLYRVEVFWDWLSRMGAGGKSSEELSADLIVKYHKESMKLESGVRNITSANPKLKMIRTAVQGDRLVCLLTNDGSPASNLTIESEDAEAVRIEPTRLLEKGQTGSIYLDGITNNPNALSFQLSYTDPTGMRVFKTYNYSPESRRFLEKIG